MTRKTIKIETLLEYANGYLASDYFGGDSVDSVSRRQGVIDLLEAALSNTDRYRGFTYLDQRAITKSKPGIRFQNEPEDYLVDTDPTRRMYS
jgi:hypothetical protein